MGRLLSETIERATRPTTILTSEIMFEKINDNDGLELDAVNICLFLGRVPFVIAWGHYNTASTEWLFQTYFNTFMIFINYPRWYEKRNFRKLWFWKAMLLAAVVLHPTILAGMWFVDVSTKTEWHDTATVLSVGAVAGVLEVVILNRFFNYFRPVDKLADVSDSSRTGGPGFE
jgi:peptidoglycan/LPS O-acetylase OafA/YrhL